VRGRPHDRRRWRRDKKDIRLAESEVVEINRVVDLPGGSVTIYEREVHECYRPENASTTRLVISDAVDRTRTFIAKTRDEFSELNALMRELATGSRA
jgi:hypothetical protein